MHAPVAEWVSGLGMPFRLRVERQVLHFRTPARTSRGILQERVLYRIWAETPQGAGCGECCTMPGLSPEEGSDYEKRLHSACRQAERQGGIRPGQWQNLPSIRFGLECALLAARHPHAPLWDTAFTQGKKPLHIHHLIWMDTPSAMFASMAEGIQRGFRCLKLKVGALPFGQELDMLQKARQAFPLAEIRADANGAFSPQEALGKVEKLAEAGVSCLEQPLRPGQASELAKLCRDSPIPIALDEELIYATTHQERLCLLDSIRPHALVIKPSLHGGLSGAEDWATLASERGMRWWANSALESHVGLAALAEWCALRAPDALHGLGTGLLFKDDIPGPVRLIGHTLAYCPSAGG